MPTDKKEIKEYVLYNQRYRWIGYGIDAKCLGVGQWGYGVVHFDSKNRTQFHWLNKTPGWLGTTGWVLICEL